MDMDHNSSSLSPSVASQSLVPLKQAACLNCRRSKTRCVRDAEDLKCKKCVQIEAECVIPDYRVGRKKGIKNKRDGLEKAVYRIEQEIKRSKTQATQLEDDINTPYHLQTLLSEAQGLLPGDSQSNIGGPYRNRLDLTGSYQLHLGRETTGDQHSDDQLALDDAENPLQLLARASDLSALNNASPNAPNIASPVSAISRSGTKELDIQTFFGPFHPSLDSDPEIDPVEMGLVTEEEAKTLYIYFQDHLAHTRWGFDFNLHSLEFVRKQSAFLLTSILAASALFIPTAAALSKRLSVHCKNLARGVMFSRNRSPEIVLAFMVNIPWMAPGKHWSDDETCSYMAMALTIAVDISLNKLIVPSPSDALTEIHVGRPPSDCISARKALDLDGFHDVNPASDFGKRLLRRRERIWLALFTLDRGVCLARGRNFTVPVTILIEKCNDWHKSPIADVWDGSIISSAALRRDLVDLISDVKKTCDSNRVHTISGTTMAHTLQDMIDGFFNRWYTTWAFAIGGMKDGSIPPYVEILVTHGRLSIYSSVINHPTAPGEVKRYFRAAGLSSALNVLRAAVQGESRLRSMPNNTAIMISFAACFAFYLSTAGSASNMSLTPSIRKLIEESADVLERIGTNPKHRNATSALYGRHLREVISSIPEPELVQGNMQPQYPLRENMTMEQMQGYGSGTGLTPTHMSELLQFSAMSDDQINDAINSMGEELEGWSNVPMDHRGGAIGTGAGLDWLDWFNMDVNAQL